MSKNIVWGQRLANFTQRVFKKAYHAEGAENAEV